MVCSIKISVFIEKIGLQYIPYCVLDRAWQKYYRTVHRAISAYIDNYCAGVFGTLCDSGGQDFPAYSVALTKPLHHDLSRCGKTHFKKINFTLTHEDIPKPN